MTTVRDLLSNLDMNSYTGIYRVITATKVEDTETARVIHSDPFIIAL